MLLNVRWPHSTGAAIVLSALLLSSCGGGGGSASTGTVALSLTDAPACGYDHVYVTVDHVDLSADGSSWTSLPVNAAVGRIDLLNLQNGTLLPLGQAPLAAGTYQQIRLVLKPNSGTATPNNAVVLAGTSVETPLSTPSGQQSGYKIRGPFMVTAGTLADLVIDFNACKSIVAAGRSGNYQLKPVVSATPLVVSGAISGTSSPNAQVFAEQQSSTGEPVIIASTVADATGAFTLSPVLESSVGGTVDVVLVPSAPTAGTAGFGTTIVQNVPVVARGTTTLGALLPAAATINTASGVVNVGGVPGAANLVASQLISASVRRYEVVAASTTNGTYSLSLAATGPWIGTYNESLPITLTQDIAAADVGIYRITAVDAAGSTGNLLANVSAGNAGPLDFNLAP